MKYLIVLFMCIAGTLCSKDLYPANPAVDVQHYRFQLELFDSTNNIKGLAGISITFRERVKKFELDLSFGIPGGKGMRLLHVGPAILIQSYRHTVKDKIEIDLKVPMEKGESIFLEISYEGEPDEGLIISNNKFGDRVFFGDNWPDRAHGWLPCVDHPSDKATVEYIIIAPQQYQVVASGIQMEESNLSGNKKLTHWKESTPIPTKVMTVGVARFATQLSRMVNGIPVTTWVYPQNRFDGFIDFAVAPETLEFFDRFIGPYSYDKLAHVQSKTRWGGLENAGNIFYFEDVVNGKKEREGLIAHETAHQWFGNSVTEKDWHHVWLSEGFATYLTHVYLEHKYGEDRRRLEMQKDREDIVKNKISKSFSIIDSTIVKLEDLLSINTYQKAAWVLHMLRKKVGDESFWTGVRNYYTKYQNLNALTSDFQKEMELASGKKLDDFFKSWLYQPGNPVISGRWDYDAKAKVVNLTITQSQKKLYEAKLEVLVELPGGEKPILITVDLNQSTIKIPVKSPQKPAKVTLDPNANLLFEGKLVN